MAAGSIALFTGGQMEKSKVCRLTQEQTEVVTGYHHPYQRQSSKLGYFFIEYSHNGEKADCFRIHASIKAAG